MTEKKTLEQTKQALIETSELYNRIEDLEDALRQIRDLLLIDNLSLEDCLWTAREIAAQAVGEDDAED